MTSTRNQIKIGIVWLFVFSAVSFIAYHTFPVVEVDWLYVTLLFLIMAGTLFLPFQIDDVSISLERWITIVIFLQYGMFMEFIFIQLAMLILLVSVKTSLPLSHKFFTNSIVFSITSFVSAFTFTITGGTIHSTDFEHVLFYALIYAVTYAFVNNLLLKIYFKLDGQSFSLFSKGALWDYIATLVMVPMSVSLYVLNQYMGNKSILLIGIPFLALLIAIRQYNFSHNKKTQLATAAEIGRDLSKLLTFDEVLQTYLKKIKGIVAFKDGYVVDLRSEKSLIPLIGIETNTIVNHVKNIEFTRDKEVDDGLSLSSTRIYSTRKEMKALKNIVFNKEVETVMSVPIVRDQKTEGFLLLTANQKNSFKDEDIQIMEILTNYFAVSLEKARHFEQTLNKSERCGLTGLHNYRYLNRKMEELTASYYAADIEELSVVILDIDYFKKINDTYGHENGNVILIELAKILRRYEKEGSVLARYGGEEFVLSYPNCGNEEVAIIAESIRQEIEQTSFIITSDLEENRQPITVYITISLGVATMPKDALSANELLRNADRALYIGGKQAGRNRVGVFGEIIESV